VLKQPPALCLKVVHKDKNKSEKDTDRKSEEYSLARRKGWASPPVPCLPRRPPLHAPRAITFLRASNVSGIWLQRSLHLLL